MAYSVLHSPPVLCVFVYSGCYDIQGSHRLDKIIFHDLSVTISLIVFAFAAFCRKCRKMRTFYITA